jgi:hypothetical protein
MSSHQAVSVQHRQESNQNYIDPDPYYEVIFECRDQVHVGGEITDSNFTAAIAIPEEHIELLNANSATIQSILQVGMLTVRSRPTGPQSSPRTGSVLGPDRLGPTGPIGPIIFLF